MECSNIVNMNRLFRYKYDAQKIINQACIS